MSSKFQPKKIRFLLLRLSAISIIAFSALFLFSMTSTHVKATSTGWQTSGPKILDPNGAEFIITGINWYGFETKGNVAHGLYAQNYTTIVNSIKQYGYNTIRIPFSNQMWETNPIPNANTISACQSCKGKHARDILAMIVNYARSSGLQVILDNHRSIGGNSAEANGLWYSTAKNTPYTEQNWIRDWISIQQWAHGMPQSIGAFDTIVVSQSTPDGFPVIMGFDLRNEPHTPARTPYLKGATWGEGDFATGGGVDPKINPNPNPFLPACVQTSTCHDWRLAAERAGNSVFGDAASNDWEYPLIFVEGISQYPTVSGTQANGPYDYYWWGGNLLGVNGNTNNPGAPVVLNSGGNSAGLGTLVTNKLVYSAHDYGPSLYKQGWFNTSTCYKSGCSSSSLVDIWQKFWAHINLANGVAPVWSGAGPYPWQNSDPTLPYNGYSQTPVWMGEFGTGKSSSDLISTGPGSQGQWFTDLVNFIQSSYNKTPENDSGIAVSSLQFTYWALNTEDGFGLLGTSYTGLANTQKEYTFLCSIQKGPLAIPPGSSNGQCGSTGALPNPQ